MSVYAWSGFCMGSAKNPSLSFFATMHVKDQVLGNVFGRTFSDSFRQNHHIHIVRTSCSQLPARSGIFCHLVGVVYWLNGLKFAYPMINLAFMGIIVKVKLAAKFCLHSFKWFCYQISDAKYFVLSCPRRCDRGLIVVIIYYFQIWK